MSKILRDLIFAAEHKYGSARTKALEDSLKEMAEDIQEIRQKLLDSPDET